MLDLGSSEHWDVGPNGLTHILDNLTEITKTKNFGLIR